MRGAKWAASIVFPKVGRKPDYARWLGGIRSKDESNTEAFAKLEKADLDREWERQVAMRWPNSPQRMQECLEQANSQNADAHFRKLRDIASSQQKQDGKYPQSQGEDPPLKGLKIPEVPAMMKKRRNGRIGTLYDRQTYEDFANELLWRNHETAFDKKMMDRAFKHAAKEGGELKSKLFRRMLDRCLQESDEYWQD